MSTSTLSPTQNDLQTQIDQKRQEIRTDSYAMSLGELASLYEKDEIEIHPEFQRFFRWTPFQKSRLIESLLLGIPVPSIFVSQRADGVWDVVDGLQRLSTIYEFMGILKGEDKQIKEGLRLVKTNLLTALEGKMWEDEMNPDNSLTHPQRIAIKRAKLDVRIILEEKESKAKYELFNRLNTGGSQLSDQEVRNGILVMLNSEMYRQIEVLASNEKFRELTSLTDRALIERYDMELVTRFLVLRNLSEAELKGIGDVNDFMTRQIEKIAQDEKFDLEQEEQAFLQMIELLYDTLKERSFKKYYPEKGRFSGGFTISGYEAVALGIAYHYPLSRKLTPEEVEERCITMWSDPYFQTAVGAGKSAGSRLPSIVPLGRNLFKP